MSGSLSYQPELFPEYDNSIFSHVRFNGRSGAFIDNMSLPVHRWYRYSAGFSADWVRQIIHAKGEKYCVLDPFAGVGTTLLACASENMACWGFESHPFVHRIAAAKLCGIHANIRETKDVFLKFLSRANGERKNSSTIPSKLLEKCYGPEELSILHHMREIFLKDYDNGSPSSELIWLAITAILRVCSGAGTAQWQYVLPNKKKSTVIHPITALQRKATELLQDIEYAQRNGWNSQSHIIQTDARHPEIPSHIQVDAVVTSPPYPNNYDYADATRLEMTFWGDVSSWGQLHKTVRQHLIHSCSQHAAAEKLVLPEILADPVLEPIKEELSEACHLLAEIRESRGGKKTYHTMAAAYFRDLGIVFQSLRNLCKPGASLCFVIGDSAPYGVYLKVDEWLGSLAVAAGFNSFQFEKIRDRNIKWKNRKHRVPLKEGRLWIEG